MKHLPEIIWVKLFSIDLFAILLYHFYVLLKYLLPFWIILMLILTFWIDIAIDSCIFVQGARRLAYELGFRCILFIRLASFRFISIFRWGIAIAFVECCLLVSFFAIIRLPDSFMIILVVFWCLGEFPSICFIVDCFLIQSHPIKWTYLFVWSDSLRDIDTLLEHLIFYLFEMIILQFFT